MSDSTEAASPDSLAPNPLQGDYTFEIDGEVVGLRLGCSECIRAEEAIDPKGLTSFLSIVEASYSGSLRATLALFWAARTGYAARHGEKPPTLADCSTLIDRVTPQVIATHLGMAVGRAWPDKKKTNGKGETGDAGEGKG